MTALVPLVADLFDGALNPVVAGTASFTPSVQLTDPGSGIVVASGPTVVFRPSTPTPLTWLIPTDASGWAPSGWGWNISFSSSTPGTPAGWSFKIPSAGVLYAFTSTEASPAVFTAPGSSLANGTAVALAPGSAPGGFRSNIPFFVVDAAGDTFSLAASAGGAAVAGTSAGSGSLGVVQYLSSLSPQSDVTQSAAYAQVLAGDLDGGSSADPKVTGIQGVPVSGTTPASGEVLTYNGTEYVPEIPSGDVTSVFGRAGTVTAQSGDYTAVQVGADPLGSATAAQAAAESFATAAVGTETSRAETAEALKAPLASPALTGNPTAPTQTSSDNSTKIATDAFVQTAASTAQSGAEAASVSASVMTALGDSLYGGASGAAARLAGNTSATKKFWTQTGTGSASAAPVLGTIATSDLPGSLPLLQATTGLTGYTLVNGTGTILTWTAPSDGNMHRVAVYAIEHVTSAETGGSVSLYSSAPDGTANNFAIFAGGSAAGVFRNTALPLLVEPGSTVTLSQSGPLTAGAAILWAELWAS